MFTITSLDVSNDGKQVAVCGTGKKCLFVDTNRFGKKISEVETVKEISQCVKFNPSNKRLLVSFCTGGFSVIDTSNLQEPKVLLSNSYNNLIESSFDLRFLSDDEFFIGDSDGFIRKYRFDDTSFTPLAEVFCHYQAVKTLELIPSKSLIVTGCRVVTE